MCESSLCLFCAFRFFNYLSTIYLQKIWKQKILFNTSEKQSIDSSKFIFSLFFFEAF